MTPYNYKNSKSVDFSLLLIENRIFTAVINLGISIVNFMTVNVTREYNSEEIRYDDSKKHQNYSY